MSDDELGPVKGPRPTVKNAIYGHVEGVRRGVMLYGECCLNSAFKYMPLKVKYRCNPNEAVTDDVPKYCRLHPTVQPRDARFDISCESNLIVNP